MVTLRMANTLTQSVGYLLTDTYHKSTVGEWEQGSQGNKSNTLTQQAMQADNCMMSCGVGSTSAALSFLVYVPRVWGRNAGSFPEQRLVIEPSCGDSLIKL